jgi:hypothetical protein
MKSFHGFDRLRRESKAMRPGAVVVLLLAICFGLARPALAQVIPEGDEGGLKIWAGGTASGYDLQYGERKMLGIAAFADVSTNRRFGVEGEARWLVFNQTANVKTTTYMIGPTYHRDFGRFQPYVKGLVGFGDFNFPYNLAHGSYLVIAPGGGVDYRISRRIRIRAADFEYQIWPEFTYGSMSSYGISTGLRIRVF